VCVDSAGHAEGVRVGGRAKGWGESSAHSPLTRTADDHSPAWLMTSAAEAMMLESEGVYSKYLGPGEGKREGVHGKPRAQPNVRAVLCCRELCQNASHNRHARASALGDQRQQFRIMWGGL
jgi:hypothetical protein